MPWSSPRSWGCFFVTAYLTAVLFVFPTLVGVFLSHPFAHLVHLRLPHARGGVSTLLTYPVVCDTSSPRSWGCFYLFQPCFDVWQVFPTLVGVFLMPPWGKPWGPCLPHARGGVSPAHLSMSWWGGSSPRSWGCFYGLAAAAILLAVFPTLVGVFLTTCSDGTGSMRLPHARGGVSTWTTSTQSTILSSPRSWGCFRKRDVPFKANQVFPTLVGVFPRLSVTLPARFCLPHARGGVSLVYNEWYRDQESSPRSWGCFLHADLGQVVVAVFPTLVGVFPHTVRHHTANNGLPHARGGVSLGLRQTYAMRMSSPRSWGCFTTGRWRPCWARVFPTLVGVFPSPIR